MPKQPDLICSQCPLEKCDEKSLFCAYRFLTRPNRAQRAYVTGKHIDRIKKQEETREKRRQYFQDRYKDKCDKQRADVRF